MVLVLLRQTMGLLFVGMSATSAKPLAQGPPHCSERPRHPWAGWGGNLITPIHRVAGLMEPREVKRDSMTLSVSDWGKQGGDMGGPGWALWVRHRRKGHRNEMNHRSDSTGHTNEDRNRKL